MNIFVTSPFPAESAICLPDKHIVKMPLECCQMLSIVASEKWGHGYGTLPKVDGTPYKTEKGAVLFGADRVGGIRRRFCGPPGSGPADGSQHFPAFALG